MVSKRGAAIAVANTNALTLKRTVIRSGIVMRRRATDCVTLKKTTRTAFCEMRFSQHE